MKTFDVLVKLDQFPRSVVMFQVNAKTTKEAFTKARKVACKCHSSRIRVERVE
jgi:hypothetical protein